MKAHIAAPYASRESKRVLAMELQAIGYEITSSWLNESREKLAARASNQAANLLTCESTQLPFADQATYAYVVCRTLPRFAESFCEAAAMSAEPIDPQRFASYVLDAFESAGLGTDSEIVAAGGPSTTTMTKFRKVAAGTDGMAAESRGDVLRRIEKAAGWPPGTARTLRRTGSRPRPAVDASPSSALKLDESGSLDVVIAWHDASLRIDRPDRVSEDDWSRFAVDVALYVEDRFDGQQERRRRRALQQLVARRGTEQFDVDGLAGRGEDDQDPGGMDPA